MQFPRLLTRIAKITRSKIFWSKWDLDYAMTPAMTEEYYAWKAYFGITEAVRPLHLLQLAARGNYETEIKSLFRQHGRMGEYGAYFARLEDRKKRGLGDRRNPFPAGGGAE